MDGGLTWVELTGLEVEWTGLKRIMIYDFLIFFYWCAHPESYKNSLKRISVTFDKFNFKIKVRKYSSKT